MDTLNSWMLRQADRERRVPRLESALLTDRFREYFVYRLRFFIARAAAASVIRAVKVALLFQVFPADQFLLIVVVLAATAVVGDLWWGALEALRSRIRTMQRNGSRHLVAAELSRWLWLAIRLSAAGIVATVAWVVLRVVQGGPTPADLTVAAIGVWASIELTVRAYHSGAYALRRVYRPLPSLVAAELVTLAVLALAWPFAGTYAFPIAELIAGVVAAAIALYYTAQACRMLGLPPLRGLLRLDRRLPSRHVLRRTIAPGLAYASIGVESFILLAVLGLGEGRAVVPLVTFLAALGPAVRAGFEWARLLYFDLKRLELPILRELRRRFDVAVRRLALVIGVVGWAIAAVLAVAVLGLREPALIAALLPFFVARSMLAAIQIRAFTSGAYLRLVAVAGFTLIALALAIALTNTDTLRVVGTTAVLAASAVLLASVPDRAAASDGLVSLTDWLAGLRRGPTPVTVTTINFDDRAATGEARAEARRLARWRERRIGRRISGRIERRRGAVASLGPGRLCWYDASSWTDADRRRADEWIVAIGGGLVAGQPIHVRYRDGAEAARAVAGELVERPGDDEATDAIAGPRTVDPVKVFREEFPSGAVLIPGRPAPGWVRDLASGQHRDILRAALSYARHLRMDRPAVDHEVTAFCADGSLRAIFLVDRNAPAAKRRLWRGIVRDANLLAAIGADDGSRTIRLADARAGS